MNDEFIPVGIFAKINEVKIRSLYVSYFYDRKIGRTDRFKKIDGRLYVTSFYPQTKKIHDDIERVTELYYEISKNYESDFLLAKDLLKFLPFITVYNIYQTLVVFKFQKHTVKFIEAFEKLKAERSKDDSQVV
ncbi:hypothetical protein CCAL9344_08900 [Campylobacter sp. RM9344]|uniref:Uncharacterized protein n=1 Tax=Campylobacter californiensis TaxID=1032243 RepID=A0AAW3ZV49_9BACT|nr:hypothetical protein [Campylobacter sp. RM9337]MBE3030293.1 hypothetical protein [Campylobacter sp. RM9344]MBE3608747.1 hypothetical protein [Campylobacter sp. RM9337]